MNNLKILFVCTGNTCRSPMAQAMASQLFEGFEVASAGVMAMDGQAASVNAVAAMNQRELDIIKHKAQILSEELITWADLVFTMTTSHKHAIGESDKVYTLGEYAGCGTSISDPFGGSLDDYLSCAEEIYNLLTKIKAKLER